MCSETTFKHISDIFVYNFFIAKFLSEKFWAIFLVNIIRVYANKICSSDKYARVSYVSPNCIVNS